MNWPHKPIETFYPDPVEPAWGVAHESESVQPSRFRRILWVIVTLLIILSMILPWIIPYITPRRVPVDSDILATIHSVLLF